MPHTLVARGFVLPQLGKQSLTPSFTEISSLPKRNFDLCYLAPLLPHSPIISSCIIFRFQSQAFFEFFGGFVYIWPPHIISQTPAYFGDTLVESPNGLRCESYSLFFKIGLKIHLKPPFCSAGYHPKEGVLTRPVKGCCPVFLFDMLRQFWPNRYHLSQIIGEFWRRVFFVFFGFRCQLGCQLLFWSFVSLCFFSGYVIAASDCRSDALFDLKG